MDFLRKYLPTAALPEMLNLLRAKRGPSQLAARIPPRAFLVFISRQHEIWPTLVSTKEQQQPFGRDGSVLQTLLVVFFTAYLFRRGKEPYSCFISCNV